TRRALAALGRKFVSAAIGEDPSAGSGIRFTQTRSFLASRFQRFLAGAPEGAKDLALHPKEPRFDRGCPAKPPEERSEPMDELLLDRRLGKVLRENRGLRRLRCLPAVEG